MQLFDTNNCTVIIEIYLISGCELCNTDRCNLMLLLLLVDELKMFVFDIVPNGTIHFRYV
jgi:hypothetical protein